MGYKDLTLYAVATTISLTTAKLYEDVCTKIIADPLVYPTQESIDKKDRFEALTIWCMYAHLSYFAFSCLNSFFKGDRQVLDFFWKTTLFLLSVFVSVMYWTLFLSNHGN